jgi:hypothetical protein
MDQEICNTVKLSVCSDCHCNYLSDCCHKGDYYSFITDKCPSCFFNGMGKMDNYKRELSRYVAGLLKLSSSKLDPTTVCPSCPNYVKCLTSELC